VGIPRLNPTVPYADTISNTSQTRVGKLPKLPQRATRLHLLSENMLNQNVSEVFSSLLRSIRHITIMQIASHHISNHLCISRMRLGWLRLTEG